MHKRTHAHPLKMAQTGLRSVNNHSKSIAKTYPYTSRDIKTYFLIADQVSKHNLLHNSNRGFPGIDNPSVVLGKDGLKEVMDINRTEVTLDGVPIKPTAHLQHSTVQDY